MAMIMSGPIYCCVFCGWFIYDTPGIISWKSQFRALYNGPTGIRLTGVGRYDNTVGSHFIAPPDSYARWDDEGYDSPMRDCFGAMTQGQRNHRHGFIFHDSCWHLLERALSARAGPAPLERLFGVLSSVPIRSQGPSLDWRPDFGVGGVVHTDDGLPWCNYAEDRQYGEPVLTYRANPCDATEVGQILAETPQSPSDAIVMTPSARIRGNDIFGTLPLELRLAIAMNLPTSDALNARLASRAFRPVFYDQLFWASRFKDPFDRAWLFEAQEWNRAMDWRWLYRRTGLVLIGPALRNRHRVWNISHTVIDILGLRWHNSKIPAPHRHRLNSSYPVDVSGDLWKNTDDRRYYAYRFRRGCRSLYSHYVTIPNDLLRLSIFYSQVSSASYVCGIRFTTATGSVIHIGHSGTTENSICVTEIWGFILAVGSKGIHAVKCLTGNDTTSCWLGCPNNSPKTTRFARFDAPLDCIAVGFDAFKMVSLATTTTLPRQVFETDTLRSLGLWYPDIPGPSLSVNENSFLRRSDCLRGYKPLSWTNFGGPGGKYLAHLIQVSVTLMNGLRGIVFRYDIDVPAEDRNLGHCLPDEHASKSTIIDFAIDGPGGEVINAVELDYFHIGPSSSTDLWRLYSCKMSTNRTRSCLFSCRPDMREDLITKAVDVDPGTTITGFYAYQPPEIYGNIFEALGVISENIGPRPVSSGSRG
ncbi:hypothetical protein GGR55DRAFT_678719 [Xylaria sp. FL0064]|nr:hypothetical protein GGR55DRAFT_678719 [Xylaria sp. FL0064]